MSSVDQSSSASNLKRNSISGAKVTLFSQALSMGIHFVSTFVLARLLSPDDYGLIGMVLVIIAFAGLFRDLGLSAATIQKGRLNQAEMSNLFWINALTGTALTVTVAGLSPLVAWFFGKPELRSLTVLLSSTFLIGSLGTQHVALMQRNLQFSRKAVVDVSGALITLVVSIVLARSGQGVWSLAWGSVAGRVGSLALSFLLSSFRPSRWCRDVRIGSMLRFGASITAFDFVNYFARNLDNILIGRVWGPEILGFYTRAYHLLMFPIDNIRRPINAVAFPTLSRLQDDPPAFKRYYLKATSAIALLSMPIIAFVFLSVEPIVEFVLGKQWHAVVPIFSYLAFAALIQPAMGFAGSLMMSRGEGKKYLQCGLANSVLYSCAFAIGVKWSAEGVAIAYAIANYISVYPTLRWAYKDTSVRFGDFLGACRLPAAVALAGGAAVVLLSPLFEVEAALPRILCNAVLFAAGALPLFIWTAEGRSWRDTLWLALGKERRANTHKV